MALARLGFSRDDLEGMVIVTSVYRLLVFDFLANLDTSRCNHTCRRACHRGDQDLCRATCPYSSNRDPGLLHVL